MLYLVETSSTDKLIALWDNLHFMYNDDSLARGADAQLKTKNMFQSWPQAFYYLFFFFTKQNYSLIIQLRHKVALGSVLSQRSKLLIFPFSTTETHLAEVAFLRRWHTFLVTVWWRWRWWVVVTATRVSRGRVHREWWGSTRCPPPVWAVALGVQSVPAASPLLLTQLLPLHGLSQEAVVIVISPAPRTPVGPMIPLQVHQVITAAAASPGEATVSTSSSFSPPIIRGVITTSAVVKVTVVATASTAAPLIIRTEETESELFNKIK